MRRSKHRNTKGMFISRDQNAEQNHILLTAKKYFENVAKLKKNWEQR
jgi:hypothetical protein